MIAIQFDKQRAQHFLDSIRDGKDFICPPGGWKQFDMLTLAGALTAAAFSHGAPLHQDHAEVEAMHPERREAVKAEWGADVMNAVEFYQMLTFQVMDDEYDTHFEPKMKAIVKIDSDGNKVVVPGEGCRVR